MNQFAVTTSNFVAAANDDNYAKDPTDNKILFSHRLLLTVIFGNLRLLLDNIEAVLDGRNSGGLHNGGGDCSATIAAAQLFDASVVATPASTAAISPPMEQRRRKIPTH